MKIIDQLKKVNLIQFVPAIFVISLVGNSVFGYTAPKSEKSKNNSENQVEAATTQAKKKTKKANAEDIDLSKIKDGTYEGQANGYRGLVKVSVTVKDHKITAIKVLSNSDDAAFFNRASAGVIKNILAKQSLKVDVVSGATYSSNGIIKAVKNALTGEEDKSSAKAGGSSAKSAGSVGTADESGTYKDGVYEGTGTGFRGKITVSVRIKKSKIVEIKLVKNEKDDAAYFERAWSEVPFSIIAVQSANTDKVDAVSGATYSSKGIMEAVRDALKKALAKKDTETTVETNNTNNSTNDNNTNTDNSSEDNTTIVPTTPTDQTYTGSAVCEPDEDGDFDAYDLTLEVVVSSDGKVKGIQNIKWSDKSMQSWYKDAEKKIVPQLIANGLDTSKNYDVVTGATCSSNALINAYKNAISKINQ